VTVCFVESMYNEEHVCTFEDITFWNSGAVTWESWNQDVTAINSIQSHHTLCLCHLNISIF